MTPARKLVRRMWMGHVPNGTELEMLDAALVAAERAPQGAPCKRCSGTGIMTSEVSLNGEASCGKCRGTGREVV